jgi:hypothetical protein
MREEKNALIRDKKGRFQPGHNAPGPGRPPGKTMKAYVGEKFLIMTDEEKEKWLRANKISPEMQWKMAEGNPRNNADVDVSGGLEDIAAKINRILDEDRVKYA